MQFARWFGSTAVDGWRERDSARVRSHFEPNVAACLLAQPTLPLVSPARTLATEEVARRSYLTSAPKSRWPKGSGPLGPQLSSTPRHAVAPGQPVGAVGLQELVLRRKPARRRTPSRRATSCAILPHSRPQASASPRGPPTRSSKSLGDLGQSRRVPTSKCRRRQPNGPARRALLRQGLIAWRNCPAKPKRCG